MDARGFHYKSTIQSFKLPNDVINSIDGLISILVNLRDVVDQHQFNEIIDRISRTLDAERIACLKIGYREAVSCGNQPFAFICRQKLLELNGQSDFLDVPKPSSRVIRFPYAESLLNNSEFRPVKVKQAFKENPHDKINDPSINRWPYASKLLNDIVLQPINEISEETKSKATKSEEPVYKKIVSCVSKNVPLSSNNCTNPIQDCNISSHKRSIQEVKEKLVNFQSADSVTSTSKALSIPTTNIKTNGFIQGEKTTSRVQSKKIDPSFDTGKRVDVRKRRRSDMTLDNNKDVPARTLDKRAVNKTSAKSLEKPDVKSRPDNSRKTDKSVRFNSSNDIKGKLVTSVKYIRKTPRVVKGSNKNLNSSTNSTPARRRAVPNTRKGPSVTPRLKRKLSSLDSSGVHSTLRPKAKRYKSVQSTPRNQNQEDRAICKREGTLDVKNSCSTVGYMSTTDMSSAFVETPKSTMANRRGNVRILYKRILFSTPQNKTKK